jgi:hypothetical protein
MLCQFGFDPILSSQHTDQSTQFLQPSGVFCYPKSILFMEASQAVHFFVDDAVIVVGLGGTVVSLQNLG